MIRFIDLGNQVNDFEENFAFFSTNTNQFIRFGVDDIFDSEADFLEAFEAEKFSTPENKAYLLKRLQDFIPDKFKVITTELT